VFSVIKACFCLRQQDCSRIGERWAILWEKRKNRCTLSRIHTADAVWNQKTKEAPSPPARLSQRKPFHWLTAQCPGPARFSYISVQNVPVCTHIHRSTMSTVSTWFLLTALLDKGRGGWGTRERSFKWTFYFERLQEEHRAFFFHVRSVLLLTILSLLFQNEFTENNDLLWSGS